MQLNYAHVKRKEVNAVVVNHQARSKVLLTTIHKIPKVHIAQILKIRRNLTVRTKLRVHTTRTHTAKTLAQANLLV